MFQGQGNRTLAGSELEGARGRGLGSGRRRHIKCAPGIDRHAAAFLSVGEVAPGGGASLAALLGVASGVLFVTGLPG